MKETTKLERLVGRTFIYKQDHIKIKDFYPIPEEKKINVITDKKPILLDDSDVPDFINKLLPVDEPTTVAVSVVNETQQTITSLKDILLDNIKKVQENKDYIAQANTINNSVNSLLNMVSLQMKINSKAR